jgi:hypothetical protein
VMIAILVGTMAIVRLRRRGGKAPPEPAKLVSNPGDPPAPR